MSRQRLLTSPDFGPPPKAVRRIAAEGAFPRLNFRELWQYRELLAFLVWRDAKVRYKQTFLGVGWALTRPVASMIIFSVVFGGIAGVHGPKGVPYPLFVFTGLLPWTYFASCLSSASNSVVGNVSLVTKIYFPRLLLPLGAVVSPVLDLLLSLAVLAALFGWYRETPSARSPLLLLFVLLAVAAALGVGLWLAALNVRYRDIPFAIPFVVQFWMYLTPVVYPVTLVPERYRWLLNLNPMTAVIDGSRWALVGGAPPATNTLLASVATAVVLCVTGVFFFRSAERRFADVI